MNRLVPAVALTLCGVTPVFATGASAPALPQYITVPTGSTIAHVYFPLSDRSGTPPACAVNRGGTYFEYVFDVSTASGKAVLSVLLADNTAGLQLWFGGAGTCNVNGTDEDLASIQTQ